MRLIDADNVIFEFSRMLDIADERNAKPDQKEEFKTIRTYIEWARYVVECAPIVDAVDRELYEQCKFDKDIAEEQLKNIVRCKDCVYARKINTHSNGRRNYKCYKYSMFNNVCGKTITYEVLVDDNHYCAYGEREEE